MAHHSDSLSKNTLPTFCLFKIKHCVPLRVCLQLTFSSVNVTGSGMPGMKFGQLEERIE